MTARKNRLDSTLLDRITLRPAWVGSPKVRRIAAGVLVAVALVLFVDDASGDDRVQVITAGRDLTPGTVLTSAGETARSGDSSEPKKALSAALQSEAVALPSAGEAASSAAQVVPSDAEAEDEAEGLDRWLVLLLWGVAALACVAFLFRRKRVSGS